MNLDRMPKTRMQWACRYAAFALMLCGVFALFIFKQGAWVIGAGVVITLYSDWRDRKQLRQENAALKEQITALKSRPTDQNHA